MNDFAGSATQLVAEVDCTAEGEELCSANGVEGFPALKVSFCCLRNFCHLQQCISQPSCTTKYGDPADLQSYQGSREYAYLKEFADANLKPLCSVDNIDLCEPEKKELIEKYLKMSEEELVALVESEETKINDLQADFEEEIEKLQEKYEGFQDEMDAAVNEVKNSGLSMMKAIMKTKTAPLKGELQIKIYHSFWNLEYEQFDYFVR